MEIILHSGDLVGIGDREAEVIKLLLHTVKTKGGIGIITDEGESFDFSFDDPKRHQKIMKKNQSDGKLLAHGKKWTALEIDLLAQCFDRGITLGEIANRLERTVHAVAVQLVTMGLFDEHRVDAARANTTRGTGGRGPSRSVTLMKRPDVPGAARKPMVLFDLANPPPPEYTVSERKPEWLGFPEQQPKAEVNVCAGLGMPVGIPANLRRQTRTQAPIQTRTPYGAGLHSGPTPHAEITC